MLDIHSENAPSEQVPGYFSVSYRVRPENPHAHLFRIEMRIQDPPLGSLRLSMPAWIPGSYMVRDFARNLLKLDAVDETGAALPIHKTDKQTWLCETFGKPLILSYQVFAWDLSVRGAHLDATHAYFNGPALLLRAEGLDHLPCQIELLPPPSDRSGDWRVATSLRLLNADANGFGLYAAEGYDDLIDHPVEMGRFRSFSFEVGGIRHGMAITGRHWVSESRLIKDLERICAQHAALFGVLPIDRYLFLLTVVGDGYGGLEHRYSTSLMCARDDLAGSMDEGVSAGYGRFLGLCSHEYFHLWMVKRIRPAALMEGGLDREVHTRLLWAFEGITSYYDELALVRCGCIDPKTYLGMLATTITRVMRGPGRGVQTLADSSFDAWTKFYKQDENAPNAIVSYYAKGALVALALDLTLRECTQGAVSLDDVMRALWRAHGEPGIGVPERGVEAIAQSVSGLDLSEFFALALDSTQDLDLVPLLETVGIGMRLRPSRGDKDLGGLVESFDPIAPGNGLSIRLRPGVSEAVVQSVLTGGAGERAGLAPGDTLIAVDGLRASAENLGRLLERAATQDAGVTLHLFRRDELLVLRADLQPAASDTCELLWLDQPAESVEQARRAWLASLA
ncbi:peptidase M61 domain protein [Thiorhodococcus drewsii AZ1]|uniref:Peptidase M61 domain protein n=1 Tax=Thiorhodococcus drewsii AZ1 TaxID=765913 RepID=G2DZZ3_9GAMM|nr:PDZ domain-containing protein [Thiorhodococcus drewsii]EGV32032.1 peptidase M61 domain protein [Thiorhodococcus drewsii AZ1]